MGTTSLFQPKPWLDLFQSYGRSFYTPPRIPKPPKTEDSANESGEEEGKDEQEPSTNIFELPPEVIHSILSLLEPEQFSMLAQVSTQFLPYVYDPRHWRRIARKLWPDESRTSLEKRLHTYKSWRKLCILRPRLRTNSIFTVRHQYAKTTERSATEEPEAPVFLVTYYRFLRFYSDGTVVSLATSEQPHLAFKRIRRYWCPTGPVEKDKTYPCVGSYEFDEANLEITLTLPMNHPKFPQMRTGTVYMHLTVSCTKPGAFDRLTLTNHYTTMDHDGGELVAYQIQNTKPYRLIPIWGFRTAVYRHFPRDDDRDLAQWFEMKKAARSARNRSIAS